MKQKLNAVFNDDRGVSPVIGVILMVAITVILAAVIGTFVLGLGDSLQQAPQAQLDAEAGSGPSLSLSHNGGDSIATSELRVVIEGGATIEDLSTIDSSEFTVGDTIDLASGDISTASDTPEGDSRVRVIHKPSESVILDTTVQFP